LAATISTKQAELDKQAQQIADLKQEIKDRKANYADMLRATQSSTVADKLGTLIQTGSITAAVQEAGQIYMLNQALQERIKGVQAEEEKLSALVENNQKAMADLQNDKSALDSKLQASQAKTAEMQALVDTYSVTPSADAGVFTQATAEVNRVLLEAQQALSEKASGKVYGNGDPNTYASGQCTWGVAWAAAGAGVMVGNYWGDGGAWDDGALRAGATVTAVPEAGAFVSFPPGVMGSSPKYGHIAFVGEVNPEAKTATIWEMNVYGNYSQSVRTYHYGVGESYIIP
jgi:surface antigen